MLLSNSVDGLNLILNSGWLMKISYSLQAPPQLMDNLFSQSSLPKLLSPMAQYAKKNLVKYWNFKIIINSY